MDQHNTPSSTLQGVRGATNSRLSTLQHREIRDASAESELIPAYLTPSFPHLLINITILKPSVKEVLRQFGAKRIILSLRRSQPKREEPILSSLLRFWVLEKPAYFSSTIFLVCTKSPA